MMVWVPKTKVQEGNVCMVLSLSQFAGWLMKALAVLEVRVVRQKQKQGIFEWSQLTLFFYQNSGLFDRSLEL
jgi:hypothetical protein